MKPDLTRPVDFVTYNGTDKVCTRGGLPWRSLGEVKSKIFGRAFAGAIMTIEGYEAVCAWNFVGRFYIDATSVFDLFYALPEKVEKTFWIVVTDEEIRNRQLEKTNLNENKIFYPGPAQIVPITVLVEE